MADEKEVEQTPRIEGEKEVEQSPSRGNEWEVVHLTASAYAAAPGPDVSELIDEDRGNESSKDEEDVSRAMFMSGHFVFPPSQHENLPLEIDNEIHIQSGSDVVSQNDSGLEMDKGDRAQKVNEENLTVKGMKAPEEVHGSQLDEKEKNLSSHNTKFGADKAYEGLSLDEQEQTIYSAHKLSSLIGEADISGSIVTDEENVGPVQNEPEESNLDPSSDSSESSPKKENKMKGSPFPCDGWWKRQAASFYAQAKETNAIWSVFVAAAVMGLVILGQRWHQERWQSLQSNINDEKANRMMGPLSRFKDIIVGGHQQGSIIRGSVSAER